MSELAAPVQIGSLELPPCLPEGTPKDVTVFQGRLYYQGVPVSEMLAYPMCVARLLMGVSETSLWRIVNENRIRVTPLKRISRKELDRYLEEESELAFDPKKKRQAMKLGALQNQQAA